jgi:dephospho-CoA kinase
LKKIGLTGGIGSGKSYIASILEALGVPVFYADTEAKKILNQPQTLALLSRHFEADVIDHHTGIANTSLIASIVFKEPKKLELLNAVIHPQVEKVFQAWCSSHQHKPYIIKEAAILFESGSYKNLDGVIAVVTPLQVRIQRVMQRDGVSEEQVMARIKNQWTDEQRTAKANWIIDNDNNKSILKQILPIHQQLSEK